MNTMSSLLTDEDGKMKDVDGGLDDIAINR